MRYCNKCQITIKTNHQYCPLCHQTLEVDQEIKVVEKYPKFEGHFRPYKDLFKRILMFLSFTSIIILFLINVMTGLDRLWSLIPIGSTLFFWLFISVGIFSKHNIASKLFFITIFTIMFTYMIDELSYSKGWALTYVTPLLLLSCNLAISLIIAVKKINYRDYISYLLLMVLFSLGLLLLVFSDLLEEVWPAYASIAFAVALLLFIIFFFPKSIKDEIKKRFHA